LTSTCSGSTIGPCAALTPTSSAGSAPACSALDRGALRTVTATDVVGAVTVRTTDPAGDELHGGDAGSRFLPARDGVELHLLHWPTARGPWAVLVFLHGIASHGGWFATTAADLAGQGIAVYAPDRRGSGRSGGPRGHLDRYDQALEDLGLVLRMAAAEHPGTPVFLAASSWAAKLAVVHAARPGPLAGLLLLGPGLLATVGLTPARQAAVVAGHLVRPRARLPIPLTPELYTPDPRYQALIRADPLRLLTATTSFFWQTSRLDRARGRASAALRLPVLVLQGEADRMMDVPATRAWVDGLGAADTTYRSYPGAGHTLDFEPDRRRYLADLHGWLAARVPRGSPRP
jgi:acylglycerol lipase